MYVFASWGAVHVSITVWMERYSGSGEPQNTRKSHYTTNLTQEIYWEGKPRKVAASMPMRSSREPDRAQGLYRAGWVHGLPQWPGIGGIMWPDLRAKSSISGIFFSFFLVGQNLAISHLGG